MAAPQRIPRPADARPGAPPPWSALPPERRRGLGVAVVAAAVGRGASPRRGQTSGSVTAATLVLLFEEEGEARVVLIRRARHLRRHPGEVAFPGGGVEIGEAPLAAALREASEEVGLEPADVEVVGALATRPTVSTASLVTPFVGVLPGRPHLRPEPAEVELAFDVTLAELMTDGVYHQERWDVPGLGDRPVHFFGLPSDLVWGATAWALYDLLELVAEHRGAGPA